MEVLIDKKWNKTSKYLLKPLGFVKRGESIEDFLSELDFVQAFIGDVDEDKKCVCPVYLLFKDSKKLTDFIESEYLLKPDSKRGTLIDDYDYPGYVVLLYEFPEKYRADYNKILWGKYSKTSEDFKNFWSAGIKRKEGSKTSKTYKVLYQHHSLRQDMEEQWGIVLDEDSELDSPMNIDNTNPKQLPELLDITKYI